MTDYTFDGLWVSDSNGNRASVAFWGSREKAEASLATLKDCHACHDCHDCHACRYCSQIKNAQSPIVVGPSRSDGYQFVMGASRSIHAGCRVFVSLAEARTHFETTRGGTPLGTESLLLLDQIEALAALRATGGAL